MLRYYCSNNNLVNRIRLVRFSSSSSSLLEALKKINKDKEKGNDNNEKPTSTAIPLKSTKAKPVSKFTINTNTDIAKTELSNSIRDLFKKASDNNDSNKSRPWNSRPHNNTSSSSNSNSSNTTSGTDNTKPNNEQKDNTNNYNSTTTSYRVRSNKDAYDYGKRHQQQEQEWKNKRTTATASTRNVRDELLESIANNLSTTDPLEEAEVDEITPGELRYSQYEEKMKHKREKFMKKYDLDNMPFRPKPSPLPSSSSPSSSSSSSSSSQSSSSSSPRSSRSNTFNTTVTYTKLDDNTLTFNVAELKARTAELIARQKNASNNNNTKATNTPAKTNTRGTTVVKEISIPDGGLSIRELASRLSMKVADVNANLESLGENSSQDEGLIEADVIELLALELGLQVKREENKDQLDTSPSLKVNQSLEPRAPVVCIMGHVDHGKTTLLDTLRQANIADNEAGGITQKISAFTVSVNGRQVVFLDTPGHAAFNAMRSHGAEATDIVVLVIAAEDGVQPQTIEALKYAKAASCNIIVALNKIDKIPAADRPGVRAKILAQLVEHDLVAEDYGGDAQVFEISGKSGAGVPELIEGLVLQAEVLELSAANEGPAEAVVLEASMEKGRGVVADILVRWGSLRVGDPVVVGTAFGKVKAMYTAAGESIDKAPPSTPVRLLGLRTVPVAGQELIAVSSENKAKLISGRRQRVLDLKKMQLEAKTSTDPDVSTDTVPTVNVILKADGVGTLEALQNVVKNVGSMTSDVAINVIASSVGDVSQTDLDRALTVGNSFILGFNINVIDADTRQSAKESDIKIFKDTVIYRLEDHLKEQMEFKIPKERVLVKEGAAKVQKVFQLRNKLGTKVAGLIVQDGTLRDESSRYIYRVTRDGQTVFEEVSQIELKKMKDTVHEVDKGTECGITLDKFQDFEENDIVECFKIEWRKKTMAMERER